MENTFFIGNGINRCFKFYETSWSDLLKYIFRNNYVKYSNNLPIDFDKNLKNYQLPYDYTQWPYYFYNKKDFSNMAAKRSYINSKIEHFFEIAYSYKFDKQWDIYDLINTKNIITTNFDYAIESYLCNYNYEPVWETKKLENNLYRYCLIKDKNIKIYHIHGEKAYQDTFCIGQKDYIKSKIFIRKYLSKLNIDKLLSSEITTSWIDLFFTTNIHIVGFGLCDDEIDILEVLNIRKSLKNTYHIENSIYYYLIYTEETEKQQHTARLNNYDIKTIPLDIAQFNNSYIDAYRYIFRMINNN